MELLKSALLWIIGTATFLSGLNTYYESNPILNTTNKRDVIVYTSKQIQKPQETFLVSIKLWAFDNIKASNNNNTYNTRKVQKKYCYRNKTKLAAKNNVNKIIKDLNVEISNMFANLIADQSKTIEILLIETSKLKYNVKLLGQISFYR